jgi:hypothetical protein
MLAVLLAAASVPLAHLNAAYAQETEAEAEAPEESDEMVVPEIPDTVVVPDPVSLTIVLPKTGTIRQIVFNIWLEATTKQNVGVIEQRLPKVINAFLVDLQRLMYRDTEQRFETREAGKRGFKYVGPELIPPPPPKTEEELEAEAEAAELAKENGEEIVKEPPFTPFAPVTNRYFAALQNRLLKVGQAQLPDDTLRSVQVRMFYDFWPGDDRKTR